MKCLLAGEGPTELGHLARQAPYRYERVEQGVLHRLVARCLPRLPIDHGMVWKNIRKFRAGVHRSPETRNVLGLALHATESQCTHLVFVRDRDGDSEREADIEEGIRQAQALFPNLSLGGGVAVEAIESWLLSILGHPSPEGLNDPKALLETAHSITTTSDKCDVVDREPWDSEHLTSASLRRWLTRVTSLPCPPA